MMLQISALATLPALPLLLGGCSSDSNPTTSTTPMASKAVFDYTWGANWPYCAEFGEELRTVYDEGSVGSEVTFNFTSAIRYNASLLVDGAMVDESMYDCPDEGWACPGTNDNASVYVTCGCPYTAWVQCALKQTTTQQQEVDFITCWDDQGLRDKKQTNASLEAAASNCSKLLDLDWDTVRACDVDYAGERAELLFAAGTRFMNKWPEYTPMGGPFHVPHVLIGTDLSDAEDMDLGLNSTDIMRFNEKLCSLEVDTGSCGATTTPGVVA